MDERATTVGPNGFGERLRQLRSAIGISQDELAHRAGLSTVGVGALERGTRRAPKPDTIALLADALALDARELAVLEQAAQRGRARSRTPRPDAPEATHNLPLQLTSFVGRSDQLDEIARLIDANRLVTILGSGGVGKTRTALEVALRLATEGREDVRFVELAPLNDGTFVVGRIATVLDIRLPAADESPRSLARAIKTRRLLLVVDNCEHLMADATEAVRVLLQQCPQVKILATTRERLGIMGEVVHRLPLMALPDSDQVTIAEARSRSACELFMQRALAADPDITFTDQQTPLLVEVCRRLEGIPLAIELAAAQLPMLGLDALSQRLEQTFGGGRGLRGLPDRQKTIRDTIAWSYNLLSEPERTLLRRLGVFAGGCTLAAAESVCSERGLQVIDVAGLLSSLVDKSLVNAVIYGDLMRYTLLDSTRAFARERLAEAAEQPAVSRRHAQWLAAYGDQAGREYLSRPNLVWLNEFLPDIDNVRSALDWALRSTRDDDVLLAGQIAGSFRGLWLVSGPYHECRRWITLVLARLDETQQPLVVANLLTALFLTLTGSEMLAIHERVVTVLRLVNDRLRLARELSNIAGQYCQSGHLTKAQDAIDEARQILAEQRMLKEPPSPQLEMTTASWLFASSELSVAQGQFAEARAYLNEVTALSEGLGNQYSLASVPAVRAKMEFVRGDTSLAAKYSEEAVKRANAIPRGLALQARALCVDAAIRLNMPDTRSGEAAALHAFSATSLLGDFELQLISHQNLAATTIHRGCAHIGARLLGSIEAWREDAQYRRTRFEQATYERLLTSLRTQLGPDAETYIAQGRQLDLDSAAQEVLSSGSGSGAIYS